MPPDDRIKRTPGGDTEAHPEIYVIVNGEKFPRPGLETLFAESSAAKADQENKELSGAYCSCNKVLACAPVCTCVPVASVRQQKGTTATRSRQTPVGPPGCGCVAACSCVGHTCSCHSHSEGGGRTVTGCRCAPVH